jgi:hypothetical protein
MCLAQIPKLEPQIPPISQIMRRVLGYYRRNLFVPKLQGAANRNLLYLLCHLRNPWLDPLRGAVGSRHPLSIPRHVQCDGLTKSKPRQSSPAHKGVRFFTGCAAEKWPPFGATEAIFERWN